jgi:ATP-dependent DNA helicase Rep
MVACKDDEHEAEIVVMKLSAHKFEHRTHLCRLRDPLSRQPPGAFVRAATAQPQDSLRDLRRASFFENAEIKDLISYLRLIANEDDDLSFIRSITIPQTRHRAIPPWKNWAATPPNRTSRLFAAAFEEGAGPCT